MEVKYSVKCVGQDYLGSNAAALHGCIQHSIWQGTFALGTLQGCAVPYHTMSSVPQVQALKET